MLQKGSYSMYDTTKTILRELDSGNNVVSLRYFADLISTFEQQLSYVEGIPKKDKKFIKHLAKRTRKNLRNHMKYEDIT